MNPIRFTILGQVPSHKNGYHIVTMGDRSSIAKSKEARAWERSALLQIPPKARARLEGPVAVTLRMFYPTERADLDESLVLDLLQDRHQRLETQPERHTIHPGGVHTVKPAVTERVLVQAGVYRNDRQVREKHVYHGIDKRNPRVEVEVTPLVAQQADLGLLAPATADEEF